MILIGSNISREECESILSTQSRIEIRQEMVGIHSLATISCITTDCLAYSSVCVLQLKCEATKYSVLNSLMSLNKQMNRVATRSVHASYRPVTKTSFPFPLPILAKS